MIYLQNTTEGQLASFPLSGTAPTGQTQSVTLKSTVDLTETTLQVTIISISHLYCNGTIILPSGFQPGEYEYSLGTYSSGLLVVEDGIEKKEYNKTTTYEQYIAE